MPDQFDQAPILAEIQLIKSTIIDVPPSGKTVGSPEHIDNLKKLDHVVERLVAKYGPKLAQLAPDIVREGLSGGQHYLSMELAAFFRLRLRFVTFAGGVPPAEYGTFKELSARNANLLAEKWGQPNVDALLEGMDDDILLFIREARDLSFTDSLGKVDTEITLSQTALQSILHPTTAAKSAEQRETVSLENLGIFFIENEAMIRRLTTQVVSAGFGLKNAILSAETLSEAKVLFEQTLQKGIAIHLVIVDDNFPDSPTQKGSGSNAEAFIHFVAGLLAKNEYTEALKNFRTIVFYTGTGGEQQRDDIEKSLPIGFVVRRLVKPMSTVPLQQRIALALVDSGTVAYTDAQKIFDLKDPFA